MKRRESVKQVSYRVWKAVGTNYVLFGTATRETMEGKWKMVKVDWDLPHPDFAMKEWQRFANIGVGRP